MTIDAVAGLTLIVVLAACLTAVLHRQNRSLRNMADSRSAVRLAERVLTEMQISGKPPTIQDSELRVAIRALSDAPAPAGMQWIEVTASVNGRSSTLIGVVSASWSASGGQAP